MYFDGGSLHIKTTNGRDFVLDRGFGETINEKIDENGKKSGGEFYNPNYNTLYANGHPGNKGNVRAANQDEVNQVLSCVIGALGLKIKFEGLISKTKYNLIGDVTNFIHRKSVRNKKLRKYNRTT